MSKKFERPVSRGSAGGRRTVNRKVESWTKELLIEKLLELPDGALILIDTRGKIGAYPVSTVDYIKSRNQATLRPSRSAVEQEGL